MPRYLSNRGLTGAAQFRWAGRFGTVLVASLAVFSCRLSVSGLTSFSLSDGPHVVYADAAGNINQYWYNGSPSSWTDQNLNSLASSAAGGQQSLVSEYIYLGNQLIAIEAGHR